MQHLKTFESFEMTNEEINLWSGAKNLFQKMVGVDSVGLAKIEAGVEEITSKPEFTTSVEEEAARVRVAGSAKSEDYEKLSRKIADYEIKGSATLGPVNGVGKGSMREFANEVENAQAVQDNHQYRGGKSALNESKRYQLINEEASVIQRIVTWISKKLGLEGVSWIIGSITVIVSAIIRMGWLSGGLNTVWWKAASAATTTLGPVGAALVLFGVIVFAIKMMIKINKGEI